MLIKNLNINFLRTTAFTLVQTSFYYFAYITTRNNYNFVKKLFYCDDNQAGSGVYNLNALSDAFWLSALYTNMYKVTAKLGFQDASVNYIRNTLDLSDNANQLVIHAVSSSARKLAVTTAFNSMLIFHDYLVSESSVENSFVRITRIPIKYSAIIGCKILAYNYLGEKVAFVPEMSSNIMCNFVGEVAEGFFKAMSTSLINRFATPMKVKDYKSSELVSDIAVAAHKEIQKNIEKSANNSLQKFVTNYGEAATSILDAFPFHYIVGGLIRHYTYSAYAALSKSLLEVKKETKEISSKSFEDKSLAQTYKSIVLEILDSAYLEESCYDNGSQCIIGITDNHLYQMSFFESFSFAGDILL